MGNSSSKKNGDSSQSRNERNGPKERMEPPRVSMVMRMSRMSRISIDNAFKQYVLITILKEPRWYSLCSIGYIWQWLKNSPIRFLVSTFSILKNNWILSWYQYRKKAQIIIIKWYNLRVYDFHLIRNSLWNCITNSMNKKVKYNSPLLASTIRRVGLLVMDYYGFSHLT